MKEIKDYTFEELVDKLTQEIHLGLLKNGGDGFRSAIWRAMELVLWWGKNKK
jgi:hypothetical protein